MKRECCCLATTTTSHAHKGSMTRTATQTVRQQRGRGTAGAGRLTRYFALAALPVAAPRPLLQRRMPHVRWRMGKVVKRKTGSSFAPGQWRLPCISKRAHKRSAACQHRAELLRGAGTVRKRGCRSRHVNNTTERIAFSKDARPRGRPEPCCLAAYLAASEASNHGSGRAWGPGLMRQIGVQHGISRIAWVLLRRPKQ